MTASPAAFARPWPSIGPTALASPLPRPPGWNKHPPLPALTHTTATGGIPGWQITLIAVTVYRILAGRRRVSAA